MTSDQTALTVDLNRYADQLKQQRNDALDINAQLRAVVEDLVAERDQLKAENARLSGSAQVVPVTADAG